MAAHNFSYGATASEASLGDGENESESLIDFDTSQPQTGEGTAGPNAQKHIDFREQASGNAYATQIIKANPCLTAAIILAVLVSSLLVVLATTTTVFDSYISSRSKTSDGADDDNSVPVYTSSIDFTFYRNGYDILDQFLPDTNTLLKYRFLATYDGIVEPYAEMHLMPLNFANYTQYDYKFSICSDVDSAKTTSCKHGNLWSDGTETPFAAACDPYDTYKVQVTEYYPDDYSGSEMGEGGEVVDAAYAGKLRRTADGALMCMYVRRELRTLQGTYRTSWTPPPPQPLANPQNVYAADAFAAHAPTPLHLPQTGSLPVVTP